VLPFRTPGAPTPVEAAAGMQPFEGWAINLRCIDGLDVAALPVRTVKGSALSY
jgi:hypothetical protein